MIKLRWHNFPHEEVYKTMKKGELLTITILLEYKCNFKCPFCYTLTKKFQNELTFEDWKRVILEGKELGVKTVLIAGAGEPMMVNYIWDLLEYIENNGLKTILFTNLSLINKKEANRLFNMEVAIIGKLNSFDKNTQEQIIGNISGAFKKMKTGLENLIEVGYTKLRDDGNTMLALETSVIPENINEIYDFWVYCRENNIYPIVDTVLYEGEAKNQDYDNFLVNYDILLEQMKKMQKYDKNRFDLDWPIRLVKRENNKGIIIGEIASECQRIGTNLNINSEGFVYDCFNMSKPSFGNVQEKRLNNILYDRINKGKNSIITHGLCDCRNLTNRNKLSNELACSTSCGL